MTTSDAVDSPAVATGSDLRQRAAADIQHAHGGTGRQVGNQLFQV